MRLKVAGAGGTFGTEENISVHSSVLRKLFLSVSTVYQVHRSDCKVFLEANHQSQCFLVKLDKLLVPMCYYTDHYRYQVLHVITSVVPKTSCHSDVTLFGSFGLPTKEPYTVLIESVFKKQSGFFFVLFFTVVFFFPGKVFLVLLVFIKMCVFFNNDGKNDCLYSNLLQFPYRHINSHLHYDYPSYYIPLLQQ